MIDNDGVVPTHPLMVLEGPAPKKPFKKRKMLNAAQLGARAQAIIQIVNPKVVTRLMVLLPYCSLKGPRNVLPIVYPAK